MKIAHDVYSETNPAFCTYALAAFTTAYLSINTDGPEAPTAYLALPLALSGDLGETFVGTNKNTGLLEWIERNPQIQVGFADRVNSSMNIVTEAIRFGCFTRVLILDNSARFKVGDQKLKKSTLWGKSDDPSIVIRRAERLGYWFATAGSTRAVFDMMGITV